MLCMGGSLSDRDQRLGHWIRSGSVENECLSYVLINLNLFPLRFRHTNKYAITI
jgi:hypothetical protein